MKRILYAAAILAVAAGCAKEVIDVKDEKPVDGNLVSYTFKATLPETKATVDATSGTFAWSANDEIAVYNTADSKFYTFKSAAGDGEFTGTAPSGAVFSVAYYPASIATGAAEVTLPASYTLADATAGKTLPMRADASGSTLPFEHLGAILQISLKDVPANAKRIELSSDATLAGAFTPAEVSGKMAISAGSTASSVVVNLNLSAKSDVTVTLPVPVGNYGYTIKVDDGATLEMLSKTASAKQLDRATLHVKKALTVTYPVTDRKLIGRYNVGGVEKNWGAESLVAFAAVEGQWGWNKATVEVPDYYIDFKIYKEDGNVYTGNALSDSRKVVGTIMPIASDGDGSNISVYTNRSSVDVYYNPGLNKLFTLPGGAEFVVPTTEAGEAIDEYALIGWHASDSWSSDFFQEAVYGFDDWRVVRIGTNGTDPHFSFKYRKNGGWSDQIGGIYNYSRKASTLCYAKTSNASDITFYVAAGDYDVYLNKDLSKFFILPAGTAFSVPDRKEQEDLVSILSIIGGINGTNWSQSYPLEFASADNHEWYSLKQATKISGWGAMVFKIYNGAWGKGLNVGWPSSLDGSIGAVSTVYPLWLRDGDDDIPNIQLDTDGGEVDIYIKADLSEIFTLPHGTAFAVPSSAPVTPPKTVFIGDSITYFWDNSSRGNPSFFSTNNYMSKGVEGQTSAQIKTRFNYDVISNNPQQVHILCGTNDLAGNGGSIVAPADICQNIADMAAAAKAAGIDVFIASALPCNYLWWNTSVNPADDIITLNGLLKTLCTSNGYTYVNYYDALVDTSTKGLRSEYSLDGCHPTKAAYTVMEGIVQPLL